MNSFLRNLIPALYIGCTVCVALVAVNAMHILVAGY
jgi:hypothetical protein